MSKTTPLNELPESLVEYSRSRFREELSDAVWQAMQAQGISREHLGALLDLPDSVVAGIIQGDDCLFEIDRIPDIFTVLNRAPHFVLGTDLDELRQPIDEAD